MFDKEFTPEEPSTMGNTLPRLKEILDFEQFRQILEPVFAKEKRKSHAGRKPFGLVLMMRVFFLQRLYGLSDRQIECQVKDRMNLREFLDIENVDDILDENTVWKYEDMLAKAGT